MQARLASVDSVRRGEPVRFAVGELEVLVVNLNGVFYGLAARCTHAGAPLEEGTLNGDVLICPWHGSNFRVSDGAVLKGPAEKPLRSYPVAAREGYLYVEV